MLDDVLGRADELVELAVPAAIPPGAGGLDTAGRYIDIAYTCGLAWRLTGKDAYVDAVRRHIVAVCRAPMGPRGDCLGISEFIFGIAAAYDWCFDAFTPDEREAVRGRLIETLRWGVVCHDEGDWWTDTWINQNHEANGGLVTAALAIADTDADLAMEVLPRALHAMHHGFGWWEPDGAWPEGAGYWARTTIYSVLALAAMRTALGTDFELGAMRGFANTPLFMIAAIAPNDLMACYADCTERRTRMHLPILQWMATRCGRPEYAAYELARVATGKATALNLIWYDPATAIGAPDLPLDLRFRGLVDFVSLRGGWHDRDAIHVWTKGGVNGLNHGHLDLGGFEFDALGERWARDLGVDDYALPGYFDAVPGGRRWSIFRMGSLSHNVPQLDGGNQNQAAAARITLFVPDHDSPRAVVEYSEAYQPAAELARRGYMLVHRRALLVQDDFLLSRACRFTWSMTTDAVVESHGATAVLTLNGKRMHAAILSPAGARFTIASAHRDPPERANAGVSQLQVHVEAAPGPLRVAVLLSPEWSDAGPVPAPDLVPLGRWLGTALAAPRLP
ncbi:MAG TPA: heparinase II/III family protein [Planctomycetota bacterium]|nr:heparinase II/III family protein [Planctomycetota bacterium]